LPQASFYFAPRLRAWDFFAPVVPLFFALAAALELCAGSFSVADAWFFLCLPPAAESFSALSDFFFAPFDFAPAPLAGAAFAVSAEALASSDSA
jgi:hypothetical protein